MDDERTSSGSGRHPSRRRRKPAATRQESVQRSVTEVPRRPARDRPARRHIHWARHGIEFLVIVAGIMVSFLLNEWRKEMQDRRTEQQLLGDLITDLRQDSLNLAREINEMQWIVGLTERLSRHVDEPIPADSITDVLGPSMSYSRIPFQLVTYHAMRSSGTLSLLQDRDLVRDLMMLYEQDYFKIQEMSDIDKRFSLDRIFPFADARVLLIAPEMEAMDRMARETEWRNLLFSSLFFKGILIDAMQEQLGTIDRLLRRIEASQRH